MSPKDELAYRLNEFFEFIGIDPLLGTTFLGLMFSFFTIKDIKNWQHLSSFQRTMYFGIWFATIGGVVALIIRFVREGH